MDRREFIASSGGGIGFVLGFIFDGGTRATRAAGIETNVNAYIRVGTDESVTLLFGGCEMGQGSMTGLAQIIAEDLMVDWGRVRVEQAVAGSISYVTGGSSAVRGRYDKLRLAGAAARDMLIAAAAKNWNVPAAECYAQSGRVFHRPTGRTQTFGSVAALASTMPVPAAPALVPPSSFRIIGKPMPRVDIPAKVNGAAVFGIDARLPGMVYAAVKHCPAIGGTLAQLPATPAGAIAVIPLTTPDSRGDVVGGSVNAIAVVADNTWKAWRLARALSVKWNIPASAAAIDTAAYQAKSAQLLVDGPFAVAEQVGDVDGALVGARKVVEAAYSFPYLAHATLEPMNCTASVRADGCEVFAPTQAAARVLATAQAITGLPADKITVRTTYLGGGLGRKIEQDYVSQALQVSKALMKPVKLFWPREEDFGHDQYRPMAAVKIRAGIDSAGNVVAFHSRSTSPSIRGQRTTLAAGVNDSSATEGTAKLLYAIGSRKSEWARHPAAVPVGYWRSVGHSFNTYATETIIDELAEAAGLDGITFRQQLLAGEPRARAVVDATAAISTWRHSLPAGHAWGAALCESFGTLVCEVVDISAPSSTSVTVHRVAIAVDCGFAVNPNQVEAQMQGGMLHGLSAALWSQIPFKAGVAQVTNFNKYRVAKMREMPKVQVAIVNSGTPTGGTGEPAVPPIGPAIANAYYKLTKKRIRTLPMFPSASFMGD